MKCPFCGAEDTQVKDSRPSEDGTSIRRRRVCTSCGSRFTTFERLQLRDLVVIKRNGDKKPFDRDKIERSIKTAVRKRSVSDSQAEQLVNKLVKNFESHGDNEIPTTLIGDEIMKELASLDLVACVRFASVYKDFNDAEDFEKFIQEIKNGQDAK
jgi:transcriptional repressor NrdR